MKLAVLALAATLAGCGNGDTPTRPAPTATTASPAPVKPSAARKSIPQRVPAIRAADVVAAFRRRGLEARGAHPMEPSEYGAAPVVGHGVRFLIPSLGQDKGGRAFTGTTAELGALRHYYDALGRSSGLLFSWTFLNARRHVLVQLNGDLPRAKATAYGAVVKSL